MYFNEKMIWEPHLKGETMRTVVTAAAVTLASFGLFAGPAGSASAELTAEQTIADLESKGYTVKIDRIGTGSLDDCVVTSVRNPQEFGQWMPVVGPLLGSDAGSVLVHVTTSKTINVSLICGQAR